MSAALQVVSQSRGATIVHCAAGKDRTGTVVGLALSVAGVSDEDVVADYVATGERIERVRGPADGRPAYGEVLAGQPMDHHRPKPETMQRILRVLTEQYGGAAGWLQRAGLVRGRDQRAAGQPPRLRRPDRHAAYPVVAGPLSEPACRSPRGGWCPAPPRCRRRESP